MKLNNFMWLELQHFAEGGEGLAGGDATGTQTGANNHGDADRGTGEDSNVEVVYGITDGDDEGLDAANGQSTDGSDGEEGEDFDGEFEKLIAKDGKFRNAYEKKVQGIIAKRLKESKGRQKDASAMNGATSAAYTDVFAELARQYKLDANDPEGIARAFLGDKSRLEAEAMARGMSVDTLAELNGIERENAKFRREDEQRRADEENRKKELAARQRYTAWVKEGEALKSIYPDFDLATEAKNEEFLKRINAGIPMREVYEGMHHADLLKNAMAFTAEKVERGTADKLRANASRPVEGGAMGRASTIHKTNVDDLTGADIRKIIEQAKAGKIIKF